MSILANTKYNPGDEDPGDEDDEPKMDVVIIDVPTKEYNVSFYSKSKYIGFSFRLPKIFVNWNNRVKRKHKKHHLFKKKSKIGPVKCPKW